MIEVIFAAINPTITKLYTHDSYFILGIIILAIALLIIDPFGNYFERNYGEVPQVEQSKKKTILSTWYVQLILIFFSTLLIFNVVYIDLQHPGFMLVFAYGTALIADFIFWIKSPTREVWFFQPLIFLSLFFLIYWSVNSTYRATSFGEPDLLTPIVYLLAAVVIACDLIILIRTIKQIPPQYKNLVLQEDQPAPLVILQTILTALSVCKSADTVYLGKLTGLRQETLIQILVPLSLSNDNILRLHQKQSNAGYPTYTVSLTETGTEVARMIDNQQMVSPVQNAS